MNQHRMNDHQFRSSDFLSSGSSAMIGNNQRMANPPPIPPRRLVSNYQGYSDYRPLGSGYLGGYGYGNNWGYRGVGGYSGVGSYSNSMGYNNYGQFGGTSDVENRFVQFAEESTRPAFQSIEAMVHTFSSVTMMLESTFFAMTSSFRAILSVAENVGRLRSMFGQFLSVFTLVRFVKWLYRRILYTLGLRNEDLSDEALWRRTALQVLNGERTGPSSWPIFLFFSLIVAIPYLVHKLVNNVKQVSINANNPKEWLECNEPVYSATVLYDFAPTSADELSIKAGQKIWLAPQSLQPKNIPGWCKATDSSNVGLVPSNHIKIVGQLRKKPIGPQSMAPQTSSVPMQSNFTNVNLGHETQSTTNSDFEKLEHTFEDDCDGQKDAKESYQ
ncbi:peroxisomal membrane protein PEX13 [Orussus abietinus]|uniref:peroxisomal membrane protein PEX13 n=1 Tax=Orussus abietinus TaxID=222816 RepID=UPI000625CB9D|nr:peroxisomal membrane protein PEX13 [Orussus abietinus]XP_012288491.1 peroxisomal membrane protein PEX13 [Orussus abietinus]